MGGIVARVRTCAFAACLGACAALPWPSAQRAPAPPSAERELLDLRGVVHVHTSGSHDSPGTLAEVVAGARHAGVDWVALTEHSRPGIASEPAERDGVLLIPGFELRAAGGSLLAIGLRELPPRRLEPAALVRFARERGALAFVAHFERSRIDTAEAWVQAAPDGLELVNLHAEAEARRLALAARFAFLPAPRALRVLLSTPERNVARWEALPRADAIVGSVDAHARFRLLGRYGTLDRYRDLFALLTTHVRVRERSLPAILDALRAGRSYVALEGLERVERFDFERRGRAFWLRAPRDCRLALVCDGREVGFALAASARLAPPPGAQRCRGEARLGERLWIATSYTRLGE
jgi:hypothetical protein